VVGLTKAPSLYLVMSLYTSSANVPAFSFCMSLGLWVFVWLYWACRMAVLSG
jgi:hypothetical protein